MDKCPYCSAETRPGDNFCLNCGNRLVPSTSSPQQTESAFGDATIPASEDWVPPVPESSSSPKGGEWQEDENLMTIANTSPEPFSNWTLSLAEDGLVLALGVLALTHPLAATIVVAGALVAIVVAGRWLFRSVRRRLGSL